MEPGELMRKITQFGRVAAARLLLVAILIYGLNLLIWPMFGDGLVAWLGAKIRGMHIP